MANKTNRKKTARDTLSLARLISEPALRALAGEQSFARGTAYFDSGAVISLVDAGARIAACVVGTDQYTVTLRAQDETLLWDCTCPVGEDGEFCKHAVATSLGWLDMQAGGNSIADYTGRRELEAIRKEIALLNHTELVDLLMEQIVEGNAPRILLNSQANLNVADPIALKDTVRKALAVRGFVDYRSMRAFVQRANSVLDLLQGLLKQGKVQLAADLATYAMQRGLAAYVKIDDSSGRFGDVLHAIAALLLETCKRLQPLPADFARTLFKLRKFDDWGMFDWKDYAPLFDKAGRTAYRALAEKEWANVPARASGDGSFATEHGHITRLMEELERAAGDIDALVAVKSRDLSSAYRFLEIARILAQAGRADDALTWAERGHAAFRKQPDPRLIEFLVDEYRKAKQFDQAINVAWDNFTADPQGRSYALLKRAASAGGSAAQWKEKALAWVRNNCFGNKSPARAQWRLGGNAVLVEVLLADGDSDAALAEARAAGCPQHLWFAIAQACEKRHPADAADIYRGAIDSIVGMANNRAYDDATALIEKILDLMNRAGQQHDFTAWLDEVRAKHKAKRNFVKRLDAAMSN